MNYIYLDWNVYINLKTPRNNINDGEIDTELKFLVKNLSKKYIFPYSEAHIRDASNRYSDERRSNIELEFMQAEQINKQICIGCNENQVLAFAFHKKPMIDFFDESLKNYTNNQLNLKNKTYHSSFLVDRSQIDSEHPFHDFLESNNYFMDYDKFFEYLVSLYENVFSESSFYKKFRKYISKLNSSDLLHKNCDVLISHMWPFIDSFTFSDVNSLSNSWDSIVSRFLSFSCPNVPLSRKFIQGYNLLDFHPLFHDRLKKNKNTLSNIVRDGLHCFYASQAKYFVSEDNATRKKTEFIYKVYGIKTKVVSESEFVKAWTIVK